MIVLCATWRNARGVYDLFCDVVRRLDIQPLLMYGASGDRDIDVRMYKLELNFLNSFWRPGEAEIPDVLPCLHTDTNIQYCQQTSLPMWARCSRFPLLFLHSPTFLLSTLIF